MPKREAGQTLDSIGYDDDDYIVVAKAEPYHVKEVAANEHVNDV
jgi:hypothetical protein